MVTLITPEQAAEQLTIGKTLLYKMIQDGVLHTAKIGRRTVLRQSDVDAYINSQFEHK